MQQIKQRCKGLLALALSIMIGLTMMPVSAKAAEDELEYRLLTYYAHEYGEDYRHYESTYPEITVKSGTTAKKLGVDTEKKGLSVAEQEEIVGWNIWKTDSSGTIYNGVATVITTIYNQETLNKEDWEKAFYIHSSGSYTHVPVLEPLYHSHSIDTTIWKNDAKQHWHGCKETSTYVYGVEIPENGEKENLVPNTSRTDYTCEEEFDKADHVAAEGYEHNTDAHWQTCDVCGFVLNKAEHSWDSGVITTPATTEKEGVKTYTCTVCKATKTEAVPKTAKPTTPTKQSISKAQITGLSSKTYNGKAQTQSKLKVICEGKTLKQGTDYTVSYKNNKNIGKATVTIKGKGKYEGSIKKTFQITVAKGKTYTAGNFKYKMTKASTNGKGTVTLAATKKSKSDSKFTSCKITDTVKIGGKTFKVTAIGDNAFKGYKKLKTITIESKNLKSVGKDAVKNIHKKATIKVPKDKVKAYKKLFNKKTGFTSKMKIKKA